MNKKWSEYFQNSAHLRASRMMVFNDDTLELLKKWIPIKNNMKILDVGCGNGEFTAFISNLTENSYLVGVDLDSDFINEANNKYNKDNKNNFKFIEADGMNLPFEDNYFDIVISHTYLTSVANPQEALSEKIRVAKKEGFVASVTTQSFRNTMFYKGVYPDRHKHIIEKLDNYNLKVSYMYNELLPVNNFLNMEVAEKIPQFFGKSGLRSICMHPIGITFSLSDAGISYDIKKQFIKLHYDAEIEKFMKYILLDTEHKYFLDKEANDYISTIKEHQQFLLNTIGENVVWEWYGNNNILMIGQKSKY